MAIVDMDAVISATDVLSRGEDEIDPNLSLNEAMVQFNEGFLRDHGWTDDAIEGIKFAVGATGELAGVPVEDSFVAGLVLATVLSEQATEAVA